MNIFIVLPHLGVNGGIKAGIQNCHLLNENGFMCTIVVPNNTGNPFPSYDLAKFSTWSDCLLQVKSDDVFIFYWPPNISTFIHLKNKFIFAGEGAFMEGIANQDLILTSRFELFSVSQFTRHYYFYAYHKDSKIKNNWINEKIFYPDEMKRVKNRVGVINYLREDSQKLVSLLKQTKFIPYIFGPCSEIEVGEHLRTCDYFVSFSKGVYNGFECSEGFRLPGAEALSSGCLVVSVNSWGPLDYLQDNVNCRIAWKNTEEDVIEKLIALDVSKEKEVIRNNGIFTIRQRFNKQVIIQQLLAVIGEK